MRSSAGFPFLKAPDHQKLLWELPKIGGGGGRGTLFLGPYSKDLTI